MDKNKSWLHTKLKLKKIEHYNDINKKEKLRRLHKKINKLQKRGDMSAIWKEIENQ